jgi:CspA family cold shock protein
VLDEADEARREDKLVPTLVGGLSIESLPLGFRNRQTIPVKDIGRIFEAAAGLVLRHLRKKIAQLEHEKQAKSTTSSLRFKGTVKEYDAAEDFYYITPDQGGKDLIVHRLALDQSGIRALHEGDRVSFVLEDDRRGRGKQAGLIQRL